MRNCVVFAGLFAGKAPGADDLQPVKLRQVPGKGRKWRRQPHDALGCLVQHRLPGRLQHQHLIQRAIAVDRHHHPQVAVDLLPACLVGVVQVTHPLDLLAPLFLVPGALVAHGRSRIQAVNARALGVHLLFVGKLRLEAGDLARQLRAVKVRRGRRWLGLWLAFLGLGLDLLRFRRLGRHCGLLWRGRRHYFGLGRRRRGDLVDLAVLEWRHFGSGGYCFLLQGAAALLVVLRLEISLLRRFLAFEGGQGDVHGLADFRRFDHGKTDAKDQRQVHQGSQKQGKA